MLIFFNLLRKSSFLKQTGSIEKKLEVLCWFPMSSERCSLTKVLLDKNGLATVKKVNYYSIRQM